MTVYATACSKLLQRTIAVDHMHAWFNGLSIMQHPLAADGKTNGWVCAAAGHAGHLIHVLRSMRSRMMRATLLLEGSML